MCTIIFLLCLISNICCGVFVNACAKHLTQSYILYINIHKARERDVEIKMCAQLIHKRSNGHRANLRVHFGY